MCLHMMTEKLLLEWTTLCAWHVLIPFLISLSQHSKWNTSPAHGCQGQDIHHPVRTGAEIEREHGKQMALPSVLNSKPPKRVQERLKPIQANEAYLNLNKREGEKEREKENLPPLKHMIKYTRLKWLLMMPQVARFGPSFKLGYSRSHQVWPSK